jgi:hypothetical protein
LKRFKTRFQDNPAFQQIAGALVGLLLFLATSDMDKLNLPLSMELLFVFCAGVGAFALIRMRPAQPPHARTTESLSLELMSKADGLGLLLRIKETSAWFPTVYSARRFAVV